MVSVGNWFQEALLIPKSTYAWVLCIKWLSIMNRFGLPYLQGKGWLQTPSKTVDLCALSINSGMEKGMHLSVLASSHQFSLQMFVQMSFPNRDSLSSLKFWSGSHIIFFSERCAMLLWIMDWKGDTTSLVVQWLRLHSYCKGQGFNSWLGSFACSMEQPKINK